MTKKQMIDEVWEFERVLWDKVRKYDEQTEASEGYTKELAESIAENYANQWVATKRILDLLRGEPTPLREYIERIEKFERSF